MEVGLAQVRPCKISGIKLRLRENRLPKVGIFGPATLEPCFDETASQQTSALQSSRSKSGTVKNRTFQIRTVQLRSVKVQPCQVDAAKAVVLQLVDNT
ncbi:hypothetical protein WME96_22820 [Sorangium sp. So ce406]